MVAWPVQPLDLQLTLRANLRSKDGIIYEALSSYRENWRQFIYLIDNSVDVRYAGLFHIDVKEYGRAMNGLDLGALEMIEHKLRRHPRITLRSHLHRQRVPFSESGTTFTVIPRISLFARVLTNKTYLLFRCCLLPMHLIWPRSMMAILVQSASHSSIECDVITTAFPDFRSRSMTFQRNCCEPGSIPADGSSLSGDFGLGMAIGRAVRSNSFQVLSSFWCAFNLSLFD